MTDASVSAPTAAVIGGGPAGLMASEVLAGAGFAVTVFDQRRSLGRKFVLAGRGGLNITHGEPLDTFVSRYGAARPRLEAALRRFGPDELRGWCADLGEPTFVGSSGRVFPESLRATPLLRAWLRRLTDLGVRFAPQHRWLGFGDGEHTAISRFMDGDGNTIESHTDVTVMALGGASWPRVGGDGSWLAGFETAGVAVTPLAAANCGIRVRWSATFLERFEGQPLKNVRLAVDDEAARGDCVVTADGLEGGPVYRHSSALRVAIARDGSATISVDLQPDLTIGGLGARLDKRRPKDSISNWLRRAGIGPLHLGVLREATGNHLPSSPEDLANLIKTTSLVVEALAPIERAISTAGGVSLDEVDDSFMLHRLPGVFVAGEMLDWEAPTGGYLLQGCFSTGVAAAVGAVEWLAAT